MNKKLKIIIIFFVILLIVSAIFWLLGRGDMAILNPKGLIAVKERNLIFLATGLMLLIVIPVFATAVYIVSKYRAGNSRAQYEPDWDHNGKLEFLWWLLPGMIIFFISIIIWKSTHELDPFKPLDSSVKPITIQVVALNWKWLFIYPEQNIATVNFVEFPQNTPVNFQLTADAPMNTFIIPQLGGQVYAMAGMENQLHLMATEQGKFIGSSTEINGAGYSGMRFIAESVSDEAFQNWIHSVQSKETSLSWNVYTKLAEDSTDTPVMLYSSVSPDLFHVIINKFMIPYAPAQKTGSVNEMEMK